MSRLAYIMGTFPTLTETFVVREIEALERAGVPVELFSLRRPSPLDDEKTEGADFVPRIRGSRAACQPSNDRVAVQ